MSSFTRRDLVAFVLLTTFVVGIAALTLAGASTWALVGLGLLVGVSALMAHLQFAARRPAFQQLRRESRATRDDSKRLLRAMKALRADLVSSQEMASRIAADAASVRSELRGVRVAQQLATQTLVATKVHLEALATEVRELPTKADLVNVSRALTGSSGTAATDGELRSAVESLRWEVRTLHHQLLSDIQAMLQLVQRFNPSAPLPPLAGWAMSPTGLLMLSEEIARRDASLVVECGSGSSTLWMAFAMKAKGRGKVVALEHMQEYADRTRSVLDAHGVGEWAEVRVAPLTPVATPRGEYDWYDIEGMRWDSAIDILLVDGPPATTGKHARYPALPQLRTFLDPTGLLVVDDADRADEQEVIEFWLEEWPELIRATSPGRGIEAFNFSLVSGMPTS